MSFQKQLKRPTLWSRAVYHKHQGWRENFSSAKCAMNVTNDREREEDTSHGKTLFFQCSFQISIIIRPNKSFAIPFDTNIQKKSVTINYNKNFENRFHTQFLHLAWADKCIQWCHPDKYFLQNNILFCKKSNSIGRLAPRMEYFTN